MNYLFRKLAVPCVLSAISISQAAPVNCLLTIQGTVQTTYVGEPTSDYLNNLNGSPFTYTLQFNGSAADQNGATDEASYTFASADGYVTTYTVGGRTFSNGNLYTTPLTIQNDVGGTNDTAEINSLSWEGTWFQHGLIFTQTDGWRVNLNGDTSMLAAADVESFITGSYIVPEGQSVGTVDFFAFDPGNPAGGEQGGYTIYLGGSINSITFAVTSIPEPSTFAAIAGLGVLTLAVTRRRTRHA